MCLTYRYYNIIVSSHIVSYDVSTTTHGGLILRSFGTGSWGGFNLIAYICTVYFHESKFNSNADAYASLHLDKILRSVYENFPFHNMVVTPLF